MPHINLQKKVNVYDMNTCEHRCSRLSVCERAAGASQPGGVYRVFGACRSIGPDERARIIWVRKDEMLLERERVGDSVETY